MSQGEASVWELRVLATEGAVSPRDMIVQGFEKWKSEAAYEAVPRELPRKFRELLQHA